MQPAVHELERRARKLRERGERRKAILVWEELCQALPESPRHWALLGAALLESRRLDPAVRALRTAIWLRSREGDHLRAASLARFLLRHVAEDSTATRALERLGRAA